MLRLIIILSILIFSSSCIVAQKTSKLLFTPTSIIEKWSGIKQMGNVLSEPRSKSMAHDSLGNLYIAGYIDGTNGLDGLALIGQKDVYLTKYGPSGVIQWSKKFGAVGAFADISQGSLLVDDQNNLYLSFASNGHVDSGLTPIAAVDTYIMKFDLNGNKIWSKNFSSADLTAGIWAQGSTIDSSGNIIITGWSVGSFDGNPVVGTQDAFILKLDRNGSKIWSKQIGVASGATNITSISSDSSKNIYISGSVDRADSGTNGVIYKFDQSGNQLWTNQQGAVGVYIQYNSMLVDNIGGVYLVGTGNGSFNGHILTGVSDAFIMKINANNSTTSWFSSLGNNASSSVGIGNIMSDGTSLYIAGSTDGPFVGLGILGIKDSFLISYDLLGVKKWLRQIGMSGASVNQGTLDINFDNINNGYSLYLSGDTTVPLNGGSQLGLTDIYIAKFDSAGNRY
jgi:hypothetical protein